MTSTARAVPDTAQIVAATIGWCDRLERSDLADRLRATAARLSNPSTVMAVVGEFKQGKSQLINALIGRDVCPVDDDLATVAITWLSHRAEELARVRLMRDGDPHIQEVELGQVEQFVAERDNPGNEKQVDLVEIGLPNPVLQRGITLVDTPGAGALRSANATALQGFLPYADALLFVTDSSAPLSAPELRFLQHAFGLCPAVVVVLSKIDLYPEWQRIQRLNEDILRQAGLPDRVVAVSGQLRQAAVSPPDPELNRESGVPELMALLRAEILDGAQAAGEQRALVETAEVLGHLLAATRTRHSVLVDPEVGSQLLERLETARGRLNELRKTNSRWTTVLGDGIGDLNQEVDYLLKSRVQSLQSAIEERVAAGDPADEWETLASEVQKEAVTAAQELFEVVDARLVKLAAGVTELLHDDGLRPPVPALTEEFDPESLWDDKDRAPEKGKAALLTSALSAVRGTSSGVMLLGVMARLAGLALATPVSIGVGVVFGLKQVMDERKRSKEKRRQEARTSLRGFLNKVQLELGIRTRQIIREGHRALRDAFAQQIDELNTTVTSSAQSLRAELENLEVQRRDVVPVLEQSIAELTVLVEQVRGGADRKRDPGS